MIEVQYRLTHDGAGKKLKEEYGDVWDYPIMDHDHPFVQARFKEFIQAFGLKPKGALDTDKIVGKSVQVKLKSDTDQDGEYRPRVGKLMALASRGGRPRRRRTTTTEEDDDDEELDLDDDVAPGAEGPHQVRGPRHQGPQVDVRRRPPRRHRRGSWATRRRRRRTDEEDEEEEDDTEDEDDAEDEESEGDNYDDMSAADLKAELAERELPTNGAKKVLIARLRKDDSDSTLLDRQLPDPPPFSPDGGGRLPSKATGALMTMTEMRTNELRTDDLAMAAYLNLAGFAHTRLEMKDRRSAQSGCSTATVRFTKLLTNITSADRRESSRLSSTGNSVRVRDELYRFIRTHKRSVRH
jgi:hypothetical protein